VLIFAGCGGGAGGCGTPTSNFAGGTGGIACLFCEKIVIEIANVIANPDKYKIDFLIKEFLIGMHRCIDSIKFF